jgi:hypothetical protein
MTDRPKAEPEEDAGVRPGPAPAGMPRWVKVFIIIAIVLALAIILTWLLGVQHGPRLHTSVGSGGPAVRMEQVQT